VSLIMSETSDRTESLFAAIVALSSPTERAAYLDQACADDPALRARLESLLRAHERTGHLLDRPAENNPEPTEATAPSVALGTVISGRYKLLEPIGAGGMGTVYMAEQTTPVRRLIALKLIKPGMDSKAVLARFEAERQALALMDHPNIARVLDAGEVADGRPFFVMELVKGTPITKFCDERKLTPRERLELFVPVCQAIQHAHQKGIIHRDIKPTNVLVALYDGHSIPKVIDFGIAKAGGQPLTEKTLHTNFGAIVGTPEYMSPEQATLNQLDIDTRSDVYSLGVLLYELLTGTTPVDKARLKQAAVLEVLRMVREEEAPRPSVRLSKAETLASIAATRGTEPGKLAKLLRGDLDWIVMKALEKERNRRYDTATALAKDVQRYLADEVVEARPPSAGYRLRRFVRKNSGPLFAGSLIVFLLIVWVVSLRNANAEMSRLNEAYLKDSRYWMGQADEALVQRRLGEESATTARMKELVAKQQWLEATCLLGANLLEQKKYPEAEKRLLGIFDRVGIPSEANTFDVTLLPRVSEAVSLLARLYDETGRPEQAAEWRKKTVRPSPQSRVQE
jgi:serine/threonine protein kinase